MKKLTTTILAICLASVTAFAQDGDDATAVTETLTKYAAAVQSKDMAEIEKYVVTTDDFTIFEGGHVNSGWADYKDHHIGPELKMFLEIKYGFEDIKVRVSGDMAYATFKTSIDVKMESRSFDGKSLATAILVKTGDGWKIQHMHTSRIPKPKPKTDKSH
jgi:ketosteroid isomerase-like protein